MKLPVFVLPNVQNRADLDMLDADGLSLTAKQFSDTIGGITTLRLMVSDEALKQGKYSISAQNTQCGETLFCFAYPAGSDANKRATTGAIIFRERDYESIVNEPRLMAVADRTGIREEFLRFAKSAISEFKAEVAARNEKKKVLLVAFWVGVLAVVLYFLRRMAVSQS